MNGYLWKSHFTDMVCYHKQRHLLSYRTGNELMNAFITAAAEDHSNADCFLVAVMTHGESGLLHSCDELYPVDTLWNFFTGDKCTTLAGKPKLFFIQV